MQNKCYWKKNKVPVHFCLKEISSFRDRKDAPWCGPHTMKWHEDHTNVQAFRQAKNSSTQGEKNQSRKVIELKDGEWKCKSLSTLKCEEHKQRERKWMHTKTGSKWESEYWKQILDRKKQYRKMKIESRWWLWYQSRWYHTEMQITWKLGQGRRKRCIICLEG